MSSVPKRHDLEWTTTHVRNFWDFYNGNRNLVDQHFARQMGRSLLCYTEKLIRIGTAVDLGFGGGHLMHMLMRRGSDVYGADQSPVSVEKVNAQFAGMKHFKGATVGTHTLPDAFADTVFMVEVVEHLDDLALTNVLNEARRILKPGGHLILTTPNEENLDANKIMCPNCLAVFHPVQHVRSWTAKGLADRVAERGFICRSAEGTVLTRYSGVLDKAYRFLYLLRNQGMRPNLIYIGTKD